MSAGAFILLIAGLILSYLIIWKFEWYQAKVNHLLSDEIVPASPTIHKITLIIGCILGVILMFVSSALKPYENLTLYIIGTLAVATIIYFTFAGSNKRTGLLKGVYYSITTFLLICASMFGVVMVVILVMCYFILRIVLAMVSGNTGRRQRSGLFDFLFSGNDSSSQPSQQENYKINDEKGYERELEQHWGNTYKDDKGDYWEKEYGGFKRKEE